MYNYDVFYVNNRVNNEINLLKKEHIKNIWQKNCKKKKIFWNFFFFLLTFAREWMKNSTHLQHILIFFYKIFRIEKYKKSQNLEAIGVLEQKILIKNWEGRQICLPPP